VERAQVVRASGSVEARETVQLGFQIGGRVSRVLAEEGQFVEQGQLLAQLDAADYQLGAEMAASDLAGARAVADKAKAGARLQEIEQARIAFEQAKDEYKRMKTLYERHSLPANDFEKFEARYQATRQQLEQVKEGARTEDRRAADAQARKAAANLKLNRKRVTDTRLESPLRGVVLRRLVQPGEMVAAGHPALVIADLNPVRVRVGVPEGEIGKIAERQNATIRIPSMDGRTFQGRIELVGYAAEPSSRTFPVRVLVPNPRLELRAGMVAEAEITTRLVDRALTLPGETIVRDAQGATLVFVYYPEKGRVHARRVTVGAVVGDEVGIAEGLTAEEQVVVAGHQRLREGSPVTLVRSAE
jgi:multidrug efflux pump subunit AcrA (membrane-fusion protein)